jgi:hypothetical protein
VHDNIGLESVSVCNSLLILFESCTSANLAFRIENLRCLGLGGRSCVGERRDMRWEVTAYERSVRAAPSVFVHYRIYDLFEEPDAAIQIPSVLLNLEGNWYLIFGLFLWCAFPISATQHINNFFLPRSSFYKVFPINRILIPELPLSRSNQFSHISA